MAWSFSSEGGDGCSKGRYSRYRYFKEQFGVTVFPRGELPPPSSNDFRKTLLRAVCDIEADLGSWCACETVPTLVYLTCPT